LVGALAQTGPRRAGSLPGKSSFLRKANASLSPLPTGVWPHVRVFEGATGAQVPGFNFFAYAVAFAGGVRVAAADVNGDGRDDIITGAGAGGGPHVRAFSGVDRAELANFFAYDIGFTGGVFVAGGPGALAPAVVQPTANPPAASAALAMPSQEQLELIRAAALQDWEETSLPSRRSLSRSGRATLGDVVEALYGDW
jgi:hypothetical protein